MKTPDPVAFTGVPPNISERNIKSTQTLSASSEDKVGLTFTVGQWYSHKQTKQEISKEYRMYVCRRRKKHVFKSSINSC